MLSPDRIRSLARHPVARRGVLTAGAATAAATLIGCSPDKPDQARGRVDDVTFVTGFNITGQDSFVYAAIDKGWYRDAGIAVKVVGGGGTQRNLQHLREGNAQFATVDIAGGILELDKGTSGWAVVATIYQNSVSCLVALPSSGIRTANDLAGKRIGYTEGGVNKTIFPAYARLTGLNENTVKWISLPTLSIRPALLNGQLDAATEVVVGRPAVEAAAKQKVTMLPYSDVLRDLYGNAIGTSTKLINTNPDLVRRFRDATLKGLAWTIEHPDEAGTIMARHNPTYAPEVAAAEIRETVPYVRGSEVTVGVLDRTRLTRCIALIQGIGLIKPGLDPERFTAFDLVPQR